MWYKVVVVSPYQQLNDFACLRIQPVLFVDPEVPLSLGGVEQVIPECSVQWESTSGINDEVILTTILLGVR